MGELPADLQAVLAEEASQLASQFLSICIRAIDYCPPVDLEFGEFLRAVITADRESCRTTRGGIAKRGSMRFAKRGILPSNVDALDENALAWKAPKEMLKRVPSLSFARLRFRGDPGRPAGAGELGRQAAALGAVIADPKYAEAFGLQTPQEGSILKPCIKSIRSARRIGPDGQILFDIVAEISQRRIIKYRRNQPPFLRWQHRHPRAGGRDQVCYRQGREIEICQARGRSVRLHAERAWKHYWTPEGQVLQPERNVLKMLHYQADS